MNNLFLCSEKSNLFFASVKDWVISRISYVVSYPSQSKHLERALVRTAHLRNALAHNTPNMARPVVEFQAWEPKISERKGYAEKVSKIGFGQGSGFNWYV